MTVKSITATVLMFFAMTAGAIDASNRYRSPRNPERRVRASTELIVLHTTEAPAGSSLAKVSDRGECHFCVTEDGSVYRIVDRDKVAFHAGRSMWKGKEDVDEFSIGIECVGYHDKSMGVVQLRAIRSLVKELQAMYRLGDEQVVCHSHVAYGAPNKWHRFKHRGRKRCGMLFAMPSVRRVLQLRKRPARDDDVRAGRLRNADEFLRKVLYGTVDTLRAEYAGVSVDSTPEKNASGGIFSWMGFGKKSVPAPAGSASRSPATAVKSSGRTSSPKPTVPRTVADLRSMGYVQRGTVTKTQTASKLVGARWNAPDTYYVIRNRLFPGNTINPAKIELGMIIWTKK